MRKYCRAFSPAYKLAKLLELSQMAEACRRTGNGSGKRRWSAWKACATSMSTSTGSERRWGKVWFQCVKHSRNGESGLNEKFSSVTHLGWFCLLHLWCKRDSEATFSFVDGRSCRSEYKTMWQESTTTNNIKRRFRRKNRKKKQYLEFSFGGCQDCPSSQLLSMLGCGKKETN